MTVDERIERLTERHEALTQSVELIAHQVQSNIDAIAALTENVDKLVLIVKSHEDRLNSLE